MRIADGGVDVRKVGSRDHKFFRGPLQHDLDTSKSIRTLSTKYGKAHKF